MPRFTSAWTPGTAFGAKLRLVAGGNWRLTGSFPPRRQDPTTGETTCGPPEPVDCTGAIVLGRDRGAAFTLDPAGRRMRGGWTYFGGFSESALLRRLEGPEICNPYRESGEQLVGALWGLGTTSVGADTHAGSLSIPTSKLRGRTAFTYTAPPGPARPGRVRSGPLDRLHSGGQPGAEAALHAGAALKGVDVS